MEAPVIREAFDLAMEQKRRKRERIMGLMLAGGVACLVICGLVVAGGAVALLLAAAGWRR